MKQWQPVGGQNYPVESRDLACPTLDHTPLDNLGEFPDLSNPSEGTENENPAASGKANGADQLWESFKTEEYRNRAQAATALCLAIAECDPEDAAPILEAALTSMCAGAPIPPLLGVIDEAFFWADFATPHEIDAYALACVNRMAPNRKTAFLAYVGGAL